MITQRFPVTRTVTVEGLLTQVGVDLQDERLSYGDERALDFLEGLSRRLLRRDLSARHPELAPLGFFLRRSQLARCLAHAADASGGRVRVPRGLVFHIPPTNVATLLVYPWALSMLAGNSNVVRIPSRTSPAAEALIQVLEEAADDASPVVQRTQALVAYSRDDEITGVLSAACRLRVLWGGDATVNRLRGIPLAPDTRDLTFADRCSLCVVSAPGWLAAGPAVRDAVVEGFYNDAYWFGQAACASPLTVCWIGSSPQADAARTDFVNRLEATLALRRPPIDPLMAVEKRVQTYGLAIEGAAVSVEHRSAALATASLAPGRLLDHWAGSGTFGLAHFSSLADLAPLITRRHQTMSHFGFVREELADFVRSLGGRGLDRLVPIGEALGFEPVWDGYDLLREFSKSVTVR